VKVFRKGISRGAEPHVIIADPTNDRFMWFSERNGSRISRFDRRTGRIVEFDLKANTLPHGIVTDPNGKAIWWAEQGPDGLGKLDLSQGPIDTPFPVGLAPFPGKEVGKAPSDQSVEDAVSPDSLRSFYTLAKNIWFTEVGLITNLPGRIARLEIKK
jgi:streptogramin lyase